ncbi:MAG: diacylglycerol kinase family lipid kinase [Bacteroidetes bacterium]|jgi:YegS/Rv2252/BmrU family lipid kinase|nr:diacylglycerol kinase family lipid kinase [Bacteroidota bacterium]MBU1580576.1 diacylglycerol kinase family lipid kinase [Bacteroidota bacterium]MBU2466438.1 diacylglycerol kinase family lipid kinase [Bacteroidota bacterium]MBU2558205.1 diacylglycerol kinase family lipid kinase [Bacteroidota bacterium]MDA3941983.1 diacylglycerol kinase family lipid kinase [Bacteroidota bacterium]
MTENNKWLVIVNPTAGVGQGEKDWPLIKSLLEAEGFEFESQLTTHPFHAIELASQLIQEKGFSKIIAVGGDGTLNEVVNGIFQQTRFATTDIMLGMITIGTGNDWGRMYNFPKKYKKAIHILKNERCFLQDVGTVKYRFDSEDKNRYFINMAGMGYDALVAKKTNLMKAKGKGGTLAYLYNLITGLFQYQHTQLHIKVDDKEVLNDKVFSLSIGICKYNGGGMMQLPNAVPDDGFLDMTVIRKTSKFTVIKNIKNLYDGSFINLPEVSTFAGKQITITSLPPHSIDLETDGESLGNSPLDFGIVPKAVKLIIRKKALKKFTANTLKEKP